MRPTVAVVGGGLAGLTAAYRLRQAGERRPRKMAAVRDAGSLSGSATPLCIFRRV